MPQPTPLPPPIPPRVSPIGRSECSARSAFRTASRPRPTPSAPATATAPAPALPSTSLKVTAHEPVSTTRHALRQDPATRDALSEGRAGLGRAYRLRPRAGKELAANGLRLAGSLW